MIQDRISTVAFAAQSSLGSPAASGQYHIGVNSGAIASLEINEDDLPTTWSSRLLEGHDRGTVVPGAAFETQAMPKTIGFLLAAALGAETVTPGTPNVHEFRPNITLPYVTVFAVRGTEKYRVGDCRVSELSLTWENTKALVVSFTALGCSYEFDIPWTAATDERPRDGVLKGAGGTFEIDGTSAIVQSGTITIGNSVEAKHGSDSPMPKDVFPAMQTIEVSLSVLPADLTMFRKVVTGTTVGTVVKAMPLTGSVTLKWLVDANTSLEFVSDSLRWMTEFPDVTAEGGPVELSIEGAVAHYTDDPAKFTLKNSVAGSYF